MEGQSPWWQMLREMWYLHSLVHISSTVQWGPLVSKHWSVFAALVRHNWKHLEVRFQCCTHAVLAVDENLVKCIRASYCAWYDLSESSSALTTMNRAEGASSAFILYFVPLMVLDFLMNALTHGLHQMYWGTQWQAPKIHLKGEAVGRQTSFLPNGWCFIF